MVSSNSDSKTISLSDLYQTYSELDKAPKGKREEVILDVRTPKEWAEGHIPGSLNIPLDEVALAEHVEKLKGFKKVYIHCKMGGRAQRAFALLESKGLTNLFCLTDEGMEAWKAKGHPVEK